MSIVERQPARSTGGHDLGDIYLDQLDSMEAAAKAADEARARSVRRCPVRDCGRALRWDSCIEHGTVAEDRGQWIAVALGRLAAERADT